MNTANPITLGLLAAGMISTAALATETFSFDPDGGGPQAAIQVNTFDWKPGSALSLDSVPLATAPATTSFTTLSHASLANFLNAATDPILGTGLNSDYEYTFVTGFGEVGTQAAPGVAAFIFDAAGATNFFRMYYDPAKNKNDLAGTGFGDGTLVLSGVISNVTGSFLATGVDPALDKFLTNNYPGIGTVIGSGGTSVTVQVDTFNAAFFPNGVPKSLEFNTSQITPYLQVDPSAKFTDAGGAEVLPAIAPTNGSSGPDFQFQADANMALSLEEIIEGSCRMTGGGVTDDGEILLDPTGSPVPTASDIDGKNHYTFGGQIGAPSANQPTPFGEWTHHQFKGPAGDFVFRAGTHSAPPETKVLVVTCSDPGFCHPARPAPFQQLDWEGLGSFRNCKGTLCSQLVTDNKPNFTLHYVRVHYEDIGEPGPGGKQPHSPACTHVIGSIVDETLPTPNDCTNCPDVYQITIHKTADPNSAVLYAVGGFIDNGNIQLHPPIN